MNLTKITAENVITCSSTDTMIPVTVILSVCTIISIDTRRGAVTYKRSNTQPTAGKVITITDLIFIRDLQPSKCFLDQCAMGPN